MGWYGSVSISREMNLDGGKLTLRMSSLPVAARPLIATPAAAAKHGGRTRSAEPWSPGSARSQGAPGSP